MPTATLPRPAAAVPQRTLAVPTTQRSTRVLLVEDEPLTAEVFASALTRAGHVVEVARDGLQALRRLRERAPSIVVLDMSLPAMSGADVVRELRATMHPQLPVLVVSGSDPAACNLTEEQLRPGTWVTKPIKPKQLVALVQQLTAGR